MIYLDLRLYDFRLLIPLCTYVADIGLAFPCEDIILNTLKRFGEISAITGSLYNFGVIVLFIMVFFFVLHILNRDGLNSNCSIAYAPRGY